MVYKRYIKKKVGGKTKIYGPYYYKTKKEDGKVISEYIGKESEGVKKKNNVHFILSGLFVFLFLAFFISAPAFTGRVVQDGLAPNNTSGIYSASNETNISVSDSLNGSSNISILNNSIVGENVSISNETNISNSSNEILVNDSVALGNNLEMISNVEISTTQYPVIVGMPVKWKKKISVGNVSVVSVELPNDAKNISVYSNINSRSRASVGSFSITGGVIDSGISNSERVFFSSVVNFFKRIFRSFTGFAINSVEENNSINITIEDNATEYEIEYETPAPVAFEENISQGKKVVISSEYHYENILAYSELPKKSELDKIKLYHYDNDEKVLVDFDAYNSEGNLISGESPEEAGFENVSVDDLMNVSKSVDGNLVSFITWVVPHLSNQTYEIIIEISDAEHLDSERNFVENIYDDVSIKDNVWSSVSDGDYVRVTFEENLTGDNDITVYAKGNGSLEIYEKDDVNLIGVVDISGENWYKTFLTDFDGSNNVFDLKVVSEAGISFDYIVDPFYLNLSTGSGTNISFENNFSHVSLSDSDLVLYMPFDINTSGTTYDYTNNSNDGTLSGVTFNSSGGVYGSSYYFDGVDDKILVSQGDVLPNAFNDSSSFSVWIKSEDTGINGIFEIGSVASGRIRVYLRGDISGGSIQTQVGTTFDIVGSGLADGNWHHIVAIVNDTGNRLVYADGISMFNASTPTPTYMIEGNDLDIGEASNFYFNGSIDEVMIFNRTLSSDEVAQIYNSTYSRFYPTGEMLFQNLNFGTNNTVNISISDCQTLNGSSLQGKINSGAYQDFSSCSLSDYDFSGLSDLDNANLTVKLVSGNNFYSPVVFGNVTLNDYEIDLTAPTITFESPTPDNNSYVSSSVTIQANISDDFSGNTSSWIDFDNSLVGYWMMGDYYNSTGIYDNSSYNNLGSFQGTNFGTSNISSGVRGDGLIFDGSDDKLSIDQNGGLNLTSHNYSIFAWISTNDITTSNSGQRGIISNINTAWTAPGGVSCHLVTLSDTSKKFRCLIVNSTGSLTSAQGTSEVNDGNWHQVGLVYKDGVSIDVYVDGVSENQYTSFVGTGNGDTWYIGSMVANSLYFNGSIDEVMIFNRSLTQDEISALYDSKANKFISSLGSVDEGQHSYSVYAIDAVGNLNVSDDRTFTVDTLNPQIEFISPTLNSGATTGNNSFYINTTITDNTNSDMSAWIDWNKSLVCYGSMNYYNSTGIYDNSSYNNFGTFNGVGFGVSNISQGVRGNGLSFDGVDDYVSIGNPNSLNLSDNFSVSVWVKSLENGVLQGSLAKQDNLWYGGWSIVKTETNKFAILISNSTGGKYEYIYSNSVYTDFDWHNLVMRANNSVVYLFVDGVLQTDYSTSIDMMPQNRDLMLGRFYSNSPSLMWNGSIDEIMIFNRSLSQTEISALYNNTANRLYNNFTSLSDGIYNYSVYAIDEAGNLNITDLRNVTLDATAPQVTIALPVVGNIYASSSVTLQITTNENSTCNYSIDSWSTNNSMTSDSNGTIHESSLTLSNGDYVALFSCTDLLGNTNSSKNVSFSVSVPSGGSTGGTSPTGGSSGGSLVAESEVSLSVDSIERTLSLSKIELGQIKVENTGTTTRTFKIVVETLNSIIELESSNLTVGPGETKEIEYRLTPPKETGIYTGKIIITSTGFRKEIPVVLNVKTEKSLFDVILTIPQNMKTVLVGNNLETQIDLLEMGIKEKIDVTLNYVVKDYEGKVYLVESETIAVTDQKTLYKEFHTMDLPSGDYVLGVELIYPDGVAVASSQFKIKDKFSFSIKDYIFYIAGVVILFIFVLIFFMIRRYKKIIRGRNK